MFREGVTPTTSEDFEMHESWNPAWWVILKEPTKLLGQEARSALAMMVALLSLSVIVARAPSSRSDSSLSFRSSTSSPSPTPPSSLINSITSRYSPLATFSSPGWTLFAPNRRIFNGLESHHGPSDSKLRLRSRLLQPLAGAITSSSTPLQLANCSSSSPARDSP